MATITGGSGFRTKKHSSLFHSNWCLIEASGREIKVFLVGKSRDDLGKDALSPMKGPSKGAVMKMRHEFSS